MRAPTIAVALLLSACAINQEQQQAQRAEFERTIPTCNEGKDCEFKWAAARRWVNENAGFKIQTYALDYIETYNVVDYASTKLWARVTKEPATTTSYRIVIEMGCNNLMGCVPEPTASVLEFNRYVSATAP